MNIGSFSDLASPLFRKNEPLTAGMKPKYLMVSEQIGSDSSSTKSEVRYVVLEDENENLSEKDKVSIILLEKSEEKCNLSINERKKN